MGSKLPGVIGKDLVVIDDIEIPALVLEAGHRARYAWEEFIFGKISTLTPVELMERWWRIS